MFYCAAPNFVLTVTDPTPAGSPGSPGGLLGGGGSQAGSAGGEARGPCFHGNTDLTATLTVAQEEKCERCREHR